MKKQSQIPGKAHKVTSSQRLKEAAAVYKPLPLVKEFNYTEFKKIADKSPFTQSEWAGILHLSERTLQRYAKNNGTMAPIHAERALQVEKLLKEARQAFGNVDLFYAWLKRNPTMIEGTLSLESLSSLGGIEMVNTELKRIQHGLFA